MSTAHPPQQAQRPHHHHDKGHEHSHEHHQVSSKKLGTALLVTLIVMSLEYAGGVFSNSLSLMTDATHMASDSLALGLNLILLYLSSRPRTRRVSFGYGRLEVLGGLITCLLIWSAALLLLEEAFSRFRQPPEVQGPVVVVIAVIGFFANLFVLKVLHSSQSHSLSVRAAYMHVISDLLGSVGAITSGVVIWATHWWIADVAISILFCGLMILSSIGLLKESISTLLNSTPSHLDPDQVSAALSKLQGVVSVHDLHIWSLNSHTWSLSVHLGARASSASEHHLLIDKANSTLRSEFGITHTTIQIDAAETECAGCENKLAH